MSSIYPDKVTAAGVVIRNLDGTPTGATNVQNAYVPASGFVANCELTALPNDCTARIEAKQINAIVSELTALAQCFDPNGPWDCNSLTNLCAAFSTWALSGGALYIGVDPPAAGTAVFWWNSEVGVLSVRFDDTWVQANGVVVDEVTIIGTGFAGRPLSVGTIDCGTY
jgi:hypothetical protein